MRPLNDIEKESVDTNFNPRTPYGMRLPRLAQGGLAKKFQSTHPLRDATWATRYYKSGDFISIHAPLTGCDFWIIEGGAIDDYFNPRTPYGMRRQRILLFCKIHLISIHAPLTGCDRKKSKITT